MPTVVGKRARVALTGILGLVMLMGLSGCGGGGSTPTGKKADVTVDSTNRFTPDRLQIALNRDDTFTFLNKDSKVHNVTVPGFAIDIDIPPGQRVDVKIPAVNAAPRDGFYSFYCKYHQSDGESGRINISR